MNTMKLTVTQLAILTSAINDTEGKLVWFPDTVKGGARKKVIDSMFKQALIATDGTDWFVAAEGYAALGLPRRGPITLAALDACIAAGEAAQHGASQVLADEAGGEMPSDAEIDTSNEIDPEIDSAVTAIATSARTEIKMPRTRDNSKQAQVIAMLQRPEGATISQICEATGWQQHYAEFRIMPKSIGNPAS
jgi:hypothetical protein